MGDGWGCVEGGVGASQSAYLQNDFISAGERPSIFHDKGITMMKDALSAGILHHRPPLDQTFPVALFTDGELRNELAHRRRLQAAEGEPVFGTPPAGPPP